MARTLLLAISILLAAAGSSQAQTEPAGKKPADPRDELRYDGKPFAYWESFGRNELKAERRVEAIRALAAFGSRGYAKEAAVQIVEMLKEYDNARTAFSFGTSKPEAMTADQLVVRESLWALGKIGADASLVVAANLDRKAVAAAAWELYVSQQYSPEPISEAAVPALVGSMQSTSDEVRKLAIEILGNTMWHQEDAKSRDRLRIAFAKAVQKEKNEAAVVDALTKSASAEAVRLLGALGPRARSATAMLVRLELENDDGDVRDALAAIKPTAEQRTAGLMLVLTDDDSWPSARMAAAKRLGETGSAAKPAVADLLKEINRSAPDLSKYYHGATRFWEVRIAVVEAYVEIAGAKDALPTITELLEKNRFPEIERPLVQVFLKLEKDPKRTVGMLTRKLEILTTEPDIKPVAYREPTDNYFFKELLAALGAQGEHAGSAVPLLIKIHAKAGSYDKIAIIVALGKIGPAASDALPMLSKSLQVDNAKICPETTEIRRAAAEAIQAITKKK